MQFTLRKAHRVVKELQNKLTIQFETKQIHRSSSPEVIQQEIENVNALNVEAIKQSLQVQDAITQLRSALQIANGVAVDGNTVDSLLSRKVNIESQMRILQLFRSENKKTDEEVIQVFQQEIADINQEETFYGSSYRAAGGISPSQHNEFNKQYVELKKEQEKVSDTLAYINNKLEVALDDKYSELLTKLQIV